MQVIFTTNDFNHNIYPSQFSIVGIEFGLLGYANGIIWMSYIWAGPNDATFVSFNAVTGTKIDRGTKRTNRDS